MIYKRCSRCGKRIPAGEKCNCIKTTHKREYISATGIKKNYHLNRWVKLRDSLLSLYSYTDQWALLHGEMKPAEIIHHIIPAEEDPALFWSPDNLIPVSRASHDAIHELYRAGGDTKAAAQAQLRSAVRSVV